MISLIFKSVNFLLNIASELFLIICYLTIEIHNLISELITTFLTLYFWIFLF
jgi:hypothetical protein